MSYDLFFHKPGLTESQFSAYFSGRANYQMGPRQAVYENEDTGVSFMFEFGRDENDEDEQEADELVSERPDASFNLNFFRPHYFALEAEPEVRAFIERFDLQISDGQVEGMGDGPFTTDGFLRGWNKGNEFAYRAFLKMEDGPEVVASLPTAELDSIWGWNYAHKQYQEKLGERVFVPRIMFLTIDSKLCSVSTWAEGIPSLLPITDGLLIGRKPTGFRRLFKRDWESCYVPFEAARRVLPSQPVASTYARPAILLDYVSPPSEIVQFIKSLKPMEQFDGIHPSQVLNRELVERAQARA